MQVAVARITRKWPSRPFGDSLGTTLGDDEDDEEVKEIYGLSVTHCGLADGDAWPSRLARPDDAYIPPADSRFKPLTETRPQNQNLDLSERI